MQDRDDQAAEIDAAEDRAAVQFLRDLAPRLAEEEKCIDCGRGYTPYDGRWTPLGWTCGECEGKRP